jgi:disulfide bond formation protein DsbB
MRWQPNIRQNCWQPSGKAPAKNRIIANRELLGSHSINMLSLFAHRKSKMKSSKLLLVAIALACFALLGGALYLQFAKYMLPCPWCVIQRYAFAAIGLISLVTAFLPAAALKRGAGLSMLTALCGGGAASWLLWVQAHPSVSCGIDPMETSLNHILPARLLPFLFRADGMCTTEYDPILGLSLPQWSLLAFIGLAIVLGILAFRRPRP